MIKLRWSKMDEKLKNQISSIRPLTLLIGGKDISEKRMLEIVKENTKENATILFGVLTDEWIPGQEDCPQFAPLKIEKVENYLKEIEGKEFEKNKVAILEHEYSSIKYLIRELTPDRIIRIRGSWTNVLHYQTEFWEAYEQGKKIETISPYCNEEEAKFESIKLYSQQQENIKRITEKSGKDISKLNERDRDVQIMHITEEVSKLSWDWTGRTGSLLFSEGKIISYSENVVVPYPGYMLQNSSLRETHKTPIGEHLEYGETNHAEPACLLRSIGKEFNKEKAVLYTTKFPCPFCARIIADLGIKKVVYGAEYYNEIGYKVLKEAGVETIKLI